MATQSNYGSIFIFDFILYFSPRPPPTSHASFMMGCQGNPKAFFLTIYKPKNGH